MPRQYRKKESFRNDQTRLAYKRQLDRERQREYYWRKKREGRKQHLFPFLLPMWRKWTPERYRAMVRDLGFTLDYLHSSVLSKNTLRMWEENKEFVPSDNILIRMTMFAEEYGWWKIYPFPPKVILVFGRRAKEVIAACRYWRLNPEHVRWIRTLKQLDGFTHSQVLWMIDSSHRRSFSLLSHPVARRFQRKCAQTQMRQTVRWVGQRGSKREVPVKVKP